MRDARGLPSPREIRGAASPMRMSPAAIIGLAASAPPDGLTRTASAEPERLAQDQLLMRERRVQLGDVDLVSPTAPACSPASAVDGDTRQIAHAEVRAPRCDDRCRGSRPARLQSSACAIAGTPAPPRMHRRRSARSRACAAATQSRARRAASLRSSVAGSLRVRVCSCVATACAPPPRPCRARCLPLGVDHGARLQRGEQIASGQSGARVVRIELEVEHVRADRPATTCRSRTPAPCRPRRSGASPRPRRAPTRRPSRRATRRSAATRRPRRARVTNANGCPAR